MLAPRSEVAEFCAEVASTRQRRRVQCRSAAVPWPSGFAALGVSPGLGAYFLRRIWPGLSGVEDSVAAISADGEGLSVVFERVGRGLCAFVVDLEAVVVFDEDELCGGVACSICRGRWRR